MKMRKIFGACALLLALTAVGCGGNKSDAPASSSSAKPASTQQSTNKPASTAATTSAPTSTSSAAPAPEVPTWPTENPMPVARTWTEGTPAANADGKNYTPLNDAAANKVGVKIAIGDYSPESTGNFTSGKLPTTAGQAVIYKVKAPKAGIYQMIMKGKVSDGQGNPKTFSERGIIVKVNDYEEQANVYGDRVYGDAGLDFVTDDKEFVVALVNLTGKEDAISLENPYYRVVFKQDVDIVFAEI